MADKFKVVDVDEGFEVLDQHGKLVKLFLLRPSDGSYARCAALVRAWRYVESISSIKW